MMEIDNNIAASEFGSSYGNGVHQLSEAVAGDRDGVPNGSSGVKGLEQNLQSITIGDVTHEATTTFESNPRANSEGHEAKESGESKNSKQAKAPGKAKIGKPSSPKNAEVKKSKDGKDASVGSVVSNGSLASQSRTKQTYSLGAKSKSFNDRKTADNNSKPVLTRVNVSHAKKLSGEPDTNAGDLMVKTKPKPLKKADESIEPPLSPAADAKPRKLGTLPTYNMSFKCDERAEKRKEFYTKLEEKIHAKEVEKSTLQAKSKETQEAEIKMLRKSLKFKATPMPSFYQEPAPPKVELKKIPTTRAKSPKLGRRKSPPTKDVNDTAVHPIRLSLDESVSQNPAEGHSHENVKKPIRKSLPKLPSQKIKLSLDNKKPFSLKSSVSKESDEGAPNKMSEVASKPSSVLVHEATSAIETSESEFVVEAEAETSTVQEPIVV